MDDVSKSGTVLEAASVYGEKKSPQIVCHSNVDFSLFIYKKLIKKGGEHLAFAKCQWSSTCLRHLFVDSDFQTASSAKTTVPDALSSVCCVMKKSFQRVRKSLRK